MNANLKTTIRSYYFDTRKPEEAEAYEALANQLKKEGLKCFETWGGKCSHFDRRFIDGREIELETSSLFNNQWNTAPINGVSDTGMRVFDWAQDYPVDFDKRIKRGHFLEITPEMREVRKNTHKCRYCGAMEPAQKGYVFCPHCIGSQYLKASDLHLTRMKAIDDTSDCAPLTDAERDYLMPQFKEAQLHGKTDADKARIAKERQNIEREFQKAITDATAKRDGYLWFMDRGIRTDNLIFYNHTGRFCYGWRSPVDAVLLSSILDVISEFPFPYDIKTDDGHTLSGN